MNKRKNPRQWAGSREPGCVDRMLALAAELGLTLDDMRHWPHHIVAELAEGWYWDEECWARYDGREVVVEEDWHAAHRADADHALAGGLEGVIVSHARAGGPAVPPLPAGRGDGIGHRNPQPAS